MITEIELENVRLFEGAGWKFQLRPLSVICGTNSTGKSTLLKSLLLLRQSQGIHESYNIQDGRLRFVGSQVDLGDFSSYVSFHDTKREVSIGVTISDEMSYSSIYPLISSFLDSKKYPDDKSKRETLVPYFLKCCFKFALANASGTFESGGVSRSNEFAVPQCVLTHAYFIIQHEGVDVLFWEVNIVNDSKGDIQYEILMPESYFEKVGGLDVMSVDSLPEKKCIKTGTVLDGLLPDALIAKQIKKNKDGKTILDDDKRPWPLPPALLESLRDFRVALALIDYLGPLRSPAKRYYVTSLDANPPTDPTGEFIPYILRYQSKNPIQYMPPKQNNIKESTLAEALNSWVHYIRTGQIRPESLLEDEIELETNKVLLEFKIRSVYGKGKYTLADSGFGYSQVLPIVVQGLVMDEGGTLIVEQPELHLNPALQVRLSEFFVSLARTGIQVLVETHSEHIVNTIRVLAAEDETGSVSSTCVAFFIDTKSDRPVVHELSIQPDGTIPEWPYDFFGEAASLTGRLLKAQKRFIAKQKGAG